jgi:hypothetical protein
VTYPDDGDMATDPGDVGSPVRVELESDFKFLPILGIGTIKLRGAATMRIENNVPLHVSQGSWPPPCL